MNQFVTLMDADDVQIIKWFVDLFFAMYNDMRSHTRAIMELGNGAIISESTKQKCNAQIQKNLRKMHETYIRK